MADQVSVQLDGRLAGVTVRAHPVAAPPVAGSAVSSGGPQAAAAQLEAQREELKAAVAAVRAAAAKFEELQDEMVTRMESHLVDLAIEIARKVLMQEIRAERYEIDPIVREALGQLPPRQEVAVHLNPEDLKQCRLAAQDDGPSRPGSLRFLADPSVHRAECVLDTSEGVVESAVDLHLADIAETLKQPE